MTEVALKVELENLSEVKRKLKVEVPFAEVSKEVDRAYQKLGKEAKVKGFRPGKVPRSVLELYYHKQVEQEVAETLVRRSLGEALKEKALEPVNLNWPEPIPQTLGDEDFCYSVEVEVNPEFTVEDYRGLTLEAPEVEVTDEVVDARLGEIRESNALLKPAPEGRGIQEGDFVVLDYQGYFAGQPVEGGKAENYFLEVGSGKFDHEFERQLLGLTPGGEARFAVELPKDFFHPLLAGKVVEFKVKVSEVKEKVVAELDDAFAQALGGNFQTMGDLRAAVREDIIKVKERERQAHLESQVLDQLLGRTSFEVPPFLIQQEQEQLFREQWERMRQYGLDPQGVDHTKMLEAIKPKAERRVRSKLLLERIAAQEGLAVDDAELEEGLARVAAQTGRDVAQMRQFYQEHDLMESLRRTLRDEKTMKFLLDQANIVSPGEAPAEATAPQESD
jgi:trigger factor